MRKDIDRIKIHIQTVWDKYIDIDDSIASYKINGETWSLKEIIGHLIDSAANNYQRFIRLQESSELVFPGYNYDWVNIVKYNSYSFIQILDLWKQFNFLLCHIIENIDDSKLNNKWIMDDKSLSLVSLITDYVDHMEIHIDQLQERYSEISAKMTEGNQ